MGESQNGDNKNPKHAKLTKKRKLLTPWYASFPESLVCFAFMLPPI